MMIQQSVKIQVFNENLGFNKYKKLQPRIFSDSANIIFISDLKGDMTYDDA